MTFFVRKRLALGPIRFGVTPRRLADAIDDDPALSTGPGGEFVRRNRQSQGFFFGDTTRFDAPSLPVAKSVSSTPFWSSLKTEWWHLALLAAGALFILLGLAVVARKGAQGWVEVILGLIMIGTPIALTAQQRKVLREKEERERAERAATEKRNRELLAAYASALERVRRDRSPDALEALARERAALTLPDEIWVPAARRTTLLIGFEDLSAIDDVARAAGLTDDDIAAIKSDIHRTMLWHLLADDRLGGAQEARLRELGYDGGEPAAEQFARLRGVTAKNLPQIEPPLPLRFQERAIHQSNGLVITNKRLVVLGGKKPVEVPLPQLNDIDVDADENVLTIDNTVTKKPIVVRVDDAIYTAALLELVASVSQRPRGFS
jgi:hypothetical protein